MKIKLVSKRSDFEAYGELDIKTKNVKVLKGSKIAKDIANSKTFKGANTIEKNRQGIIKNNILQEDKVFKSPSTAANFVTGRSTNGLIAWKTEDGKKIKEVLDK